MLRRLISLTKVLLDLVIVRISAMDFQMSLWPRRTAALRSRVDREGENLPDAVDFAGIVQRLYCPFLCPFSLCWLSTVRAATSAARSP